MEEGKGPCKRVKDRKRGSKTVKEGKGPYRRFKDRILKVKERRAGFRTV